MFGDHQNVACQSPGETGALPLTACFSMLDLTPILDWNTARTPSPSDRLLECVGCSTEARVLLLRQMSPFPLCTALF